VFGFIRGSFRLRNRTVIQTAISCNSVCISTYWLRWNLWNSTATYVWISLHINVIYYEQIHKKISLKPILFGMI